MAITVPRVNKPYLDDIKKFTYDSRITNEEEHQEYVDEDPTNKHGVPIFENFFGDTFINVKVLLPQGG